MPVESENLMNNLCCSHILECIALKKKQSSLLTDME